MLYSPIAVTRRSIKFHENSACHGFELLLPGMYNTLIEEMNSSMIYLNIGCCISCLNSVSYMATVTLIWYRPCMELNLTIKWKMGKFVTKILLLYEYVLDT